MENRERYGSLGFVFKVIMIYERWDRDVGEIL